MNIIEKRICENDELNKNIKFFETNSYLTFKENLFNLWPGKFCQVYCLSICNTVFIIKVPGGSKGI